MHCVELLTRFKVFGCRISRLSGCVYPWLDSRLYGLIKTSFVFDSIENPKKWSIPNQSTHWSNLIANHTTIEIDFELISCRLRVWFKRDSGLSYTYTLYANHLSSKIGIMKSISPSQAMRFVSGHLNSSLSAHSSSLWMISLHNYRNCFNPNVSAAQIDIYCTYPFLYSV